MVEFTKFKKRIPLFRNPTVYIGPTGYNTNWQNAVYDIIDHYKFDYFNASLKPELGKEKFLPDLHPAKNKYSAYLYIFQPNDGWPFSRFKEDHIVLYEILTIAGKYPRKTLLVILDGPDGKQFSDTQQRAIDYLVEELGNLGVSVVYNLDDVNTILFRATNRIDYSIIKLKLKFWSIVEKLMGK